LGVIPFRADAALLELKPYDHVAMIGNALPDRMQHHALNGSWF
jgi:hypothetical protein